MKMELLGSDKLKILLASDDMTKLDITYDQLDYKDADTRRVILELLGRARTQTGFDASYGKLFIEAFPDIEGGCILYFSLVNREEPSGKKKLRIKSSPSAAPIIYEFPSMDTLLHAAAALHAQCGSFIYKNTLYRIGTGYRLLVYPFDKYDNTVRMVLNEFGKFTGDGLLCASFTAEHGKPLIENLAIEKLVEFA